MQVYINKTEKWYDKDDFLANILFQGASHSTTPDVSGTVITCENRPFLNDTSCTTGFFNIDQFYWPNDSNEAIFTGSKKFGVSNPLKRWDYTIYGDTIQVCVHAASIPFLPDDPAMAILSSVLLIISTAGLFFTIATYSLFSDLRNLPGLNLMALCTTMGLYQLIFLAGVNETVSTNSVEVCTVVAILLHYLTLSTFFWANVMAWDLFKTFGNKAVFSRIRSRSYFKSYTAYALGTPFLIVSSAIVLDFSQLIPGIKVDLRAYFSNFSNFDYFLA